MAGNSRSLALFPATRYVPLVGRQRPSTAKPSEPKPWSADVPGLGRRAWGYGGRRESFHGGSCETSMFRKAPVPPYPPTLRQWAGGQGKSGGYRSLVGTCRYICFRLPRSGIRLEVGGYPHPGLSKTWMFLTSPHGWVHGGSRMGVPARLSAR